MEVFQTAVLRFSMAGNCNADSFNPNPIVSSFSLNIEHLRYLCCHVNTFCFCVKYISYLTGVFNASLSQISSITGCRLVFFC
jgi:hypothetical protein